ncbi:NUDIX hydrolase [Mesorhizobium sp. ZC-5]|uniref:NUDIX hydrolase n=1 Tax=Mesorhizobium sp. ZC-5 TaxID=2986066 RepID=UPI0021E80153|nr:NUDIX domain-containing protein [Mesorhizobium sp. ZC-5]MCV3240122.1 NUDIX domain-containing protein [Mesorhizobium sp. ZC-5]
MTSLLVPAVSVALVRDDRVLLVRRGRPPSLGLYAFPGGRVEAGETAEAAARRELFEETGLATGKLVPHREYLIEREPRGKSVGFRLQVFSGSYAGGEAIAGDDAAEAGWFTLAEMEKLPVIDSVLEVARELLLPPA